MKSETVIGRKGETTIPDPLRRELGLQPGTVLTWSIHDGELVARRKSKQSNAMQRHIVRYAGTLKGKIPGKELLKRTRR